MATACASSPLDPDGTVLYRPRRPHETILFQTILEHLETWLATLREADPDDDPIPGYVEEAFRRYITCGDPAHGFGRARCGRCGLDFMVAFSCRGRGLCPACSARYMVETAAHLVDDVLPRVPHRQWVVTFPKRVRYFLREPRHASAVLRIVHRAMETTIRQASPGAPGDARVGAVSFLQRFGSSLNPHLHLHDVATDGVFTWAGEAPEDGQAREVEFYEATDLTADDVEALTETIRERVLRYLVRQDLLEDWDADQMLQWQAHGGFSVHADTRVEDWDRMGLERLVRYCARPTFSLQRLHRLDHETLIYKLPRPDHRGRTEIVLTPHELLQRLADLLPPPRMHRHRYYGCLAPNAAMRSAVTGTAGPDEELAGRLDDAADKMGITGEEGPRRSNARWAMLLARIYESLPLQCTRCGSPMELIAFITDPDVVTRILDHLGEPNRPKEPAPARSPPQIDFDWEIDDAVASGDHDDLDQTCWP